MKLTKTVLIYACTLLLLLSFLNNGLVSKALATEESDEIRIINGMVDVSLLGASSTEDSSQEFLNALNYAHEHKAALTWKGTINISRTISIDFSPRIIGVGRRASTLKFYNGASLQIMPPALNRSNPKIKPTLMHGIIRDVTFEDGEAAGKSYGPMIVVGRALGWEISGIEINGNNNRYKGAWFGKGSTIWASRITGSRFYKNKIGVVVGHTGDATHNFFANNTIDQNSICGAIFANPHGGSIKSNSFEHNSGKTGLAILSSANVKKGNYYARNFEVSGNYIFNNGKAQPGASNSAGISVGKKVPDTEFHSYRPAWGARIVGNYIVSEHTLNSIVGNFDRGGEISNNTVMRKKGAKYDIIVSGYPKFLEIKNNFNQKTAERDKYLDTTISQVAE